MNTWDQFSISGIMIIFFMIYSSGCEETFEPLQENDQYAFSMYGTLDLHADTQWVRVMPVGESLIPTNPEPNGNEVTITREAAGDTFVMSDSLFRFGGNAYVWNYYTTENIQPNEVYTIRTEAPDGQQSWVNVTTPSVLPVPEVEYSEEDEIGVITGSSVEPLVTVEFRYLVQALTDMGCAPETEIILSHLNDVFVDQEGNYRLSVENKSAIAGELGVYESSFIVNKREVVVISASEDWPDISELNDEEIVLPDAVSNVENGTGVVAGIARRLVEITPRRPPCGPG